MWLNSTVHLLRYVHKTFKKKNQKKKKKKNQKLHRKDQYTSP